MNKHLSSSVPKHTETYVVNTVCPHCGVAHDRATSIVEDGQPQEGAISVCVRCANISSFTSDGSLRKLLDTELEEIKKDKKTWDNIKRLQEIFKRSFN